VNESSDFTIEAAIERLGEVQLYVSDELRTATCAVN
jgi:hypothetical protein